MCFEGQLWTFPLLAYFRIPGKPVEMAMSLTETMNLGLGLRSYPTHAPRIGPVQGRARSIRR